MTLTATFREAFHIAKTGRPGPVLIDVPSDLASDLVTFEYPDDVDLPSYKPTYRGNAKQVRAAVARIQQAVRVLYVGGGVVSSEYADELGRAGRRAAAVRGHHAHGQAATFPASQPAQPRPRGHARLEARRPRHGQSDLVIACRRALLRPRDGASFAEFAPHADVIHIDIDPAEIGKVREVQIPIVGDLRGRARRHQRGRACQGRRQSPATAPWLAQIAEWRRRHPVLPLRPWARCPGAIVPETVMQQLSRALDPARTIVVTEVGQHQMWAAQRVDRRECRARFISSGGLGTMGFGFPAAVGAAIGCPDKTRSSASPATGRSR